MNIQLEFRNEPGQRVTLNIEPVQLGNRTRIVMRAESVVIFDLTVTPLEALHLGAALTAYTTPMLASGPAGGWTK